MPDTISKKELIAEAARRLIGHSDTPQLDSELLLTFATGQSRTQLLADLNDTIPPIHREGYDDLITKRIQGYSVAVITGSKWFYGRNFHVSTDVLIPRPETEMLVDEALLLSKKKKKLTIIEVGTGSGCIICTLASELRSDNGFRYLASDISSEALAIAKKNALALGLANDIEFRQGNLLTPWQKKINAIKHEPILIVANLPYLTTEQILSSPSIRKEPLLALDGGRDGLELYESLFLQIRNLNIEVDLIIEIDPVQEKKAAELVSAIFPGNSFRLIKDYSGNYRHIHIPVGISNILSSI